jgi:hypothetical protein
VNGWYTIGLCLGLGVGLGMIASGLIASTRIGFVVAVLVAALMGAAVGWDLGDAPEAVAGGVGGLLGALAAGAVVQGAMRRGATRLGIAAFVGGAGALAAFLALIPIAGYIAAVALPALALRMRGREATRYAGLRTLAK